MMLVVMACTSCKAGRETRDLRKLLHSFESSTIELPDKLLKIEGQSKEFCRTDMSIPALIYYHGPDKCSECAITHLSDTETMFQKADSSRAFQVLVIISPRAEEVSHVIGIISEKQFVFPVYVDVDGHMSETPIPEDIRFHSFLLYDKHPVMVGNPLSSSALMSIFTKALTATQNERQHSNN